MTKSRTIWGGAIIAAGTVFAALGPIIGGEMTLQDGLPELVTAIGIFLGAIGLRGAIGKIG